MSTSTEAMDAARREAETLLAGAYGKADGSVWFPGTDGDGFSVFKERLVSALAVASRDMRQAWNDHELQACAVRVAQAEIDALKADLRIALKEGALRASALAEKERELRDVMRESVARHDKYVALLNDDGHEALAAALSRVDDLLTACESRDEMLRGEIQRHGETEAQRDELRERLRAAEARAKQAFEAWEREQALGRAAVAEARAAGARERQADIVKLLDTTVAVPALFTECVLAPRDVVAKAALRDCYDERTAMDYACVTLIDLISTEFPVPVPREPVAPPRCQLAQCRAMGRRDHDEHKSGILPADFDSDGGCYHCFRKSHPGPCDGVEVAPVPAAPPSVAPRDIPAPVLGDDGWLRWPAPPSVGEPGGGTFAVPTTEAFDLCHRLADEVVEACALNTKRPRGSHGTIRGACLDAYKAGQTAASPAPLGACIDCGGPLTTKMSGAACLSEACNPGDPDDAAPLGVAHACRSCGRHLVGERCPTVAPPALGDDDAPAPDAGVAPLLEALEDIGRGVCDTYGRRDRLCAFEEELCARCRARSALRDYARSASAAVPTGTLGDALTTNEKEGR